MSIASEIERIENAKTSIKTAIENKGVEVGDGLIDTYASKIDEMEVAEFEINDTSYLFYQNTRLEEMDKILKLCKDVTKSSYMYCYCSANELDLTNFDMSKIKTGNYMFSQSNINNFIWGEKVFTNVLTNASYMFFQSRSENLDLSTFDFSSVTNINSFLYWNTYIIDLKIPKNIGKGYTNKTNNASNYTFDLQYATKLTHESLMNVINNLYDLNLTYDVANGGTLYTQQLVLGATNIAKLTSEEINIAVSKGWVVS